MKQVELLSGSHTRLPGCGVLRASLAYPVKVEPPATSETVKGSQTGCR